MARQLTMAQQTTIHTLHQSGYSNREIARLTGVHRETVGKYLAADGVPAKPDHRVKVGKKTLENRRSNDDNQTNHQRTLAGLNPIMRGRF